MRERVEAIIVVQIGTAFIDVMDEAVERWPDPEARQLLETMKQLLNRIEKVGRGLPH